jgi:arsenate reductase
MTITILHNPKCSKSRQALQLLRDNGVEPQIIEYLKTPPSEQTMDNILRLMGKEPREAMRRKEPEYREQNLDNPDLSREQLIAAMIATPKLIERPIVVGNGKAALGRPPEDVLKVL